MESAVDPGRGRRVRVHEWGGGGAGPSRPEIRTGDQKLIELIVCAIESRNRWMDGAIPVDARKKPKSTATMAGPALIDPPRISTTRMIANSSTTDSEMATTDHTLRSVRSPGPGVQPRTPPPEPSCHQRGPRMPQVTHRRPGPPGNRTPPPSRDGPTVRPRTAIRPCARMGNSGGSLPCPHIPFAGISNCCHGRGEETPEGARKMAPKAPKTGHFTRVARECYAPISRDEWGQNGATTVACGKGKSSNPRYSKRYSRTNSHVIRRNSDRSFTTTHRQR